MEDIRNKIEKKGTYKEGYTAGHHAGYREGHTIGLGEANSEVLKQIDVLKFVIIDLKKKIEKLEESIVADMRGEK